MFNDLDETLEMREYCTAHEDRNLLYNFDASVTSLPRFLTATHSLKQTNIRSIAMIK